MLANPTLNRRRYQAQPSWRQALAGKACLLFAAGPWRFLLLSAFSVLALQTAICAVRRFPPDPEPSDQARSPQISSASLTPSFFPVPSFLPFPQPCASLLLHRLRWQSLPLWEHTYRGPASDLEYSTYSVCHSFSHSTHSTHSNYPSGHLRSSFHRWQPSLGVSVNTTFDTHLPVRPSQQNLHHHLRFSLTDIYPPE